ncbi:DinQ-like type I toxin DqlB, partial [Neisseria meningitidis]
ANALIAILELIRQFID